MPATAGLCCASLTGFPLRNLRNTDHGARGVVLTGEHDGAGLFEAVGRKATGFAPGDQVCFRHGSAGRAAATYTERTVIPAECLVKVPDAVLMEGSAAIAPVFITGWEAMVKRTGIGNGDMVLILSGVGDTGQVVSLMGTPGDLKDVTVDNANRTSITRQCCPRCGWA